MSFVWEETFPLFKFLQILKFSLATVCFAAIHVAFKVGVRWEVDLTLVLCYFSSIQFTPAMKQVPSKSDPLLMKQLHALSQANNRQLLYEPSGCLGDSYVVYNYVIFLNHAN